MTDNTARTCGTCKYFGKPVIDPEEVYGAEPSPYHACELVEHIGDKWTLAKATASAVTIDGSDYYAALCVREEFGCNQWAEKQPAQCEATQPKADAAPSLLDGQWHEVTLVRRSTGAPSELWVDGRHDYDGGKKL